MHKFKVAQIPSIFQVNLFDKNDEWFINIINNQPF